MPKEWVLNQVMNRFQLNFKRNVGPTSESIRMCRPKSLAEWEEYYFTHVRSREHIEKLGQTLYQKIQTVVKDEIKSISEEDCKEYMRNMVIDRTYQGYCREIDIVRGQLDKLVTVPGKIEEAPDKWDRLYAVDFFIKIGNAYLGIQIKPETFEKAHMAIIHKQIILEAHEKFQKEFGGKVFIVVSTGKGRDKRIYNPDVIQDIQKEINRLLALIP